MRNSWIKRQYEQVFIVKSGTVSSHLLLYSSLILFSSSHWPTLTRQQVVSGREPIFSGQLVLLLHELYHWRPLNKDLLVALGVSEEKKKKASASLWHSFSSVYFCFLHKKNYNTIVTPFKRDQNMMFLPLPQFFQLGISGANTNKTLKYMDLEKMRNHSILLKWDFLKISHSSGGKKCLFAL